MGGTYAFWRNTIGYIIYKPLQHNPTIFQTRLNSSHNRIKTKDKKDLIQILQKPTLEALLSLPDDKKIEPNK